MAAVPVLADRRQVATLDQLAVLTDEEAWLEGQTSARTRRAYKLDVAHFITTLNITSAAMLHAPGGGHGKTVRSAA